VVDRYVKTRSFGRITLLFFIAICPVASAPAQDRPTHLYEYVRPALPGYAVKTNLLYGLGTLTPNIAAELALSCRWTLELAYSSNPWNSKNTADNTRKLLHGIARVEARHWLCERFNGHFFGLHGLWSEFNVSGVKIPLIFDSAHRYQGFAWGGGLDYGYDLPVGRRWNIEFTAGVGVYRIKYDRFSCLNCDRDGTPNAITFLSPARLGVTVMFLFK
jgi:hypothetical protein